MIDVKKALDELNYPKIKDLINQILDLRENGRAPERSRTVQRFTLNDELLFLELGLDVHNYLDCTIWISDTEYLCYVKDLSSEVVASSYCEYNPMKEKDVTYTVYIVGPNANELEFTILLADLFVRKFAIEGNHLRDKVDYEIARIRILDSIMDLKYSDFDQFFEASKTCINIYGYRFIKTIAEAKDVYRKIYDYALQNPVSDNNADYHDLLVYVYKNHYGESKTEE